jgi:hypothetical protein
MGHFGAPQVKMATMTLGMVSMELERQKMQPVVNTQAYLDCLNKCVPCFSLLQPLFFFLLFFSVQDCLIMVRPGPPTLPPAIVTLFGKLTDRMLEPLAICQGMMGLRTWLTEIQYLMAKLKQRSFSGMPMYVHFHLLLFPCPSSLIRDVRLIEILRWSEV